MNTFNEDRVKQWFESYHKAEMGKEFLALAGVTNSTDDPMFKTESTAKCSEQMEAVPNMYQVPLSFFLKGIDAKTDKKKKQLYMVNIINWLYSNTCTKLVTSLASRLVQTLNYKLENDDEKNLLKLSSDTTDLSKSVAISVYPTIYIDDLTNKTDVARLGYKLINFTPKERELYKGRTVSYVLGKGKIKVLVYIPKDNDKNISDKPTLSRMVIATANETARLMTKQFMGTQTINMAPPGLNIGWHGLVKDRKLFRDGLKKENLSKNIRLQAIFMSAIPKIKPHICLDVVDDEWDIFYCFNLIKDMQIYYRRRNKDRTFPFSFAADFLKSIKNSPINYVFDENKLVKMMSVILPILETHVERYSEIRQLTTQRVKSFINFSAQVVKMLHDL